MGKIKKCPKCGNTTDLGMDRSPWGKSYCNVCGFSGPHALLYTKEIKDNLYVKDEYDKNKYINANESIIIAQGGDGTMLKAINKFRHLNKPFYGIGVGTENFLMNPASDTDICETAKYKKFNLIKVKVYYKSSHRFHDGTHSEIIKEFQAFNEVMMGGDMNTWAEYNVHDKDKIIGKFKGGGVSICTAQGSTGFNMGNGGSVLPLSSDQWFVTSAFSKRNIKVPIEPKRTSITVESRSPITVWVDGQNHIIENVQKIEISKGDIVTVIFNDYEAFKRKRRV